MLKFITTLFLVSALMMAVGGAIYLVADGCFGGLQSDGGKSLGLAVTGSGVAIVAVILFMFVSGGITYRGH